MNELARKIISEIGRLGALPLARFMELALYCPVYGYYESDLDSIGRAGDYYTSVSVGSLFGELLGLQFAQWLEQLPTPHHPGAEPALGDPVQIVEAGAHHGDLTQNILQFLSNRRPALFNRLEYCIVEPSERRRGWQQRRLGGFGPRVRWVPALRELAGTVRGVIFCNELLDAMPVHRFGWDRPHRRWFEWGVGVQDGRFVWQKMPDRQLGPEFSDRWQGLIEALPDGFVVETAPAAAAWWREAAQALSEGRLVTFDYGLTEAELFAPERRDGTLRAYSRHRQGADVLDQPGAQDITAHVDFSALRSAGEAKGLETEAFTTQEEFLTRIAAAVWEGKGGLGEWTPGRTRQFRTLTHPEFLGRRFRVLVQRRAGRPRARS